MSSSQVLALVVGVLAVSWAAPLIRLADAPAEVIATLRLAIAAPPVALAALAWRRAELAAVGPREVGLALLAGAALAAHFLAWVAAVQQTSVIASAVLVTTQPIFAGLGGWLLYREPPSRGALAGVGIAGVGAALLAGADLGDPGSLRGDALALAGAVFAAAYFLVGRHLRRTWSNLTYVGLVYPMSAAVLLSVAAARGTSLTTAPTEAYLYIALLALVPQLIGHTSLNWALGSLTTVAVAIAVLGEPVGATLLAATLLDEPPTLVQMGGAVIVLAGVVVGLARPGTPRLATRALEADARHEKQT